MPVEPTVQAAAGLSQALTALHLAGGSSSRADLTKRLGCGRSVMGYLLGELAEAGLVTVEAGTGSAGSSGGRPSQVVKVAPSAPSVVAVQLGTDSIAVARIGIGGTLLARRDRPLPTKPAVATVLDLLGSLIAELIASYPGALGVAIAVP